MRTTNTENIFHVEGFTSHLEVAVRAISNLSETFHQRYTNKFFRTLFLLFYFLLYVNHSIFFLIDMSYYHQLSFWLYILPSLNYMITVEEYGKSLYMFH